MHRPLNAYLATRWPHLVSLGVPWQPGRWSPGSWPSVNSETKIYDEVGWRNFWPGEHGCAAPVSPVSTARLEGCRMDRFSNDPCVSFNKSGARMVATGGAGHPTHAAAAPEPHVRPVIVSQAEIEVTSHARASADQLMQDCMLQLQYQSNRSKGVVQFTGKFSVKNLMSE